MGLLQRIDTGGQLAARPHKRDIEAVQSVLSTKPDQMPSQTIGLNSIEKNSFKAMCSSIIQNDKQATLIWEKMLSMYDSGISCYQLQIPSYHMNRHTDIGPT